ncbi:2-dehydro-3-deoxyphosphooctonate aldolase [Frankliniella fusca]|uniref:2-dehydro-3-deoxyphosphooctonate aldolase n=1 Tax=Frankliniella fusca TaxID=407009 RepID=A0AAE1I628_9NEOP|nr:2-dehydro-3-deoxyphosphooctonate aldolase [Frankliniella fusca]
MTESRRRQLVHENPLLVDMFFSVRVDIYIKEVLQKKFLIDDFWFRIEYQHRGSPHVHGVAWLRGAPDVTNIHRASEEEGKQKIIDYLNELISTVHPNIAAQPDLIHPCRKTSKDIHNKEEDLAQLLNKGQRHTKFTEGYCLKKKNGVIQGRFHFPMDLEETTKIIINEKNEPEIILQGMIQD